MGTIRCENCGAEVFLPEHSRLAMGITFSEDSKGDYILHMKRDGKGRFVSNKTTEYGKENNANVKENKNMMNNNNNGANNNINGGMNMNGFDMNALAAMVAQMVKSEINGQSTETVSTTETKSVNENKYKSVAQNYMDVVDGGKWAKGSKYYGKEICGFVFNPYMIRWHLQNQFEELINDYRWNVHNGIAKEYSYMYSINFTVEEIRKLAMLAKKDRIAFDERRHCFPINQCVRIMSDYYKNVIKKFKELEDEFVRYNKVGKEYSIWIKKIGKVNMGTVAEKIENHRVVKYLNKHIDYVSLINGIEKIIDQLDSRYYFTYATLYDLVKDKCYIKVAKDTTKSKDFMDCFIRSGAYYTLKQKLMFNETVELKGTDEDGLTGREAVLNLMAHLRKEEAGYIFYKYLKLTLGYRY